MDILGKKEDILDSRSLLEIGLEKESQIPNETDPETSLRYQQLGELNLDSSSDKGDPGLRNSSDYKDPQ